MVQAATGGSKRSWSLRDECEDEIIEPEVNEKRRRNENVDSNTIKEVG